MNLTAFPPVNHRPLKRTFSKLLISDSNWFDQDSHVPCLFWILHGHLDIDGTTAETDPSVFPVDLNDFILFIVDDDYRLYVSLIVHQSSFMTVELEWPRLDLFTVSHLPVCVAHLAWYRTTGRFNVNLCRNKQDESWCLSRTSCNEWSKVFLLCYNTSLLFSILLLVMSFHLILTFDQYFLGRWCYSIGSLFRSLRLYATFYIVAKVAR